MKKNFKILSAILLLCVFAGASVFADGKSNNSKPNVIFILVDDVSPAWFPPYAKQLKGDEVEKEIIEEYSNTHAKQGFDLEKHMEAARHSMPFLDKLSEQGTIFNMCFTTASLCAPSRSGILSATYQQRYGGYDIVDIEEVGVPKQFPFLTKQLSENGYATAMIGKWHVGKRDERLNPKGAKVVKGKFVNEYGFQSSCAPGQSPLENGFDYYFGYNNHSSWDYEAEDLWEGYERVPKRPEGEFLTELFNKKVAGFIEKSVQDKKPFFVYYAPKTLHGRIDPPPVKYSSAFDTGTTFTNMYAGHLLALDEGIREIYSILSKSGQDKNTIFIISSDNGAPYPAPPYNAPFKGGKGTGWLGGSHTPLIIVWPGHTEHQIINELVSTMDILPTVLDFADMKVPDNLDGKSLKPILTGETTQGPHDILFSAGLHSTRWSHSYIGEKSKTDSKACPLFAWAIDKQNVLLMITETPKGLYQTLPDGIPEQTLFTNWKVDPKQSENLIQQKRSEVQDQKLLINKWLKQLVEPVLNHQDDYSELIKMSEK